MGGLAHGPAGPPMGWAGLGLKLGTSHGPGRAWALIPGPGLGWAGPGYICRSAHDIRLNISFFPKHFVVEIFK